MNDPLESVDDDIATRLARGFGWDERFAPVQVDQDFVKLGGFGPRVIHSTQEVEPDPLLENPCAAEPLYDFYLNGVPMNLVPSPIDPASIGTRVFVLHPNQISIGYTSQSQRLFDRQLQAYQWHIQSWADLATPEPAAKEPRSRPRAGTADWLKKP